MILFFLQHASAFLTMGLAAIGALLLRAAAQAYANKDGK